MSSAKRRSQSCRASQTAAAKPASPANCVNWVQTGYKPGTKRVRAAHLAQEGARRGPSAPPQFHWKEYEIHKNILVLFRFHLSFRHWFPFIFLVFSCHFVSNMTRVDFTCHWISFILFVIVFQTWPMSISLVIEFPLYFLSFCFKHDQCRFHLSLNFLYISCHFGSKMTSIDFSFHWLSFIILVNLAQKWQFARKVLIFNLFSCHKLKYEHSRWGPLPK